MADPYSFWRARLRGENAPYVDGSFPLGFYRFKSEGTWYPLAIWADPVDGEIWWHRGPDLARQKADKSLGSLVSFAYRHPVSDAAYRHWCHAGTWPDDLPPPAGDNSADGDDPFAQLMRSLDGEQLEIERFLKGEITTQEQADKATHWAQRLAGLESDRKKAFTAEKAPALKMSKEIDAKWNAPRDTIEALRDQLRRAQQPFLIEQRRKADAEIAAQREAEKAAFLAGKQAEPASVPTRPAGTSGARGRKTRVVDVVTGRIVDAEKAMLALKAHPEMTAFVQTLVNRAYAKGLELDGCEKVVTPTTVGG